MHLGNWALLRALRYVGLAGLVTLSLVSLESSWAGGQSPAVLQRSSVSVHLVAAPASLAGQCARAATVAQVSAVCPKLVPSHDDAAMACPAPVGPQPAPCVGLAGVGQDRVFFLEFEDFDVPRGYVGVGGKAVGHLFFEARRLADAPEKPCIGGIRAGGVVIKGWHTSLYVCPNDSPYIERVARHGEGANAGHVLLVWDVKSFRYTISIHGHTTANVRLLMRLLGSSTLVPPTG